MKIVVIGGSGLIGEKLVKKLPVHGNEAVAAPAGSCVSGLIVCTRPEVGWSATTSRIGSSLKEGLKRW